MTELSDFIDEFPDAHFMRIKMPEKIPIDTARNTPIRGWPKATLRLLKEHNDKIGLYPASLGLAVIDIDRGGNEILAEIIFKLETAEIEHKTYKTQRENGYHIYIPVRGEVSNLVWLGGEVRGSKGYIILHALEEILGTLGEIVDAQQEIDRI